jgi:hypothetical protein
MRGESEKLSKDDFKKIISRIKAEIIAENPTIAGDEGEIREKLNHWWRMKQMEIAEKKFEEGE